MDIKCSEEELVILNKMGEAGQALNMPVYVIGGFVRDKLLNRITKDADIVCLGDGISLAKKAAQLFRPVPEVHIFKNFGTAQIKIKPYQNLNNSEEKNPYNDIPFEIEFVGARKESYNFESRKPDVEPATIEEDRMRRDFTINTISIGLNN